MVALDRNALSRATQLARPAQGQGPPYLVRFALLNLPAAGLVAAAWAEGWLMPVFAADATRLTVVIAVIFVGGLFLCAQRLWRIDMEIACVRRFDPCRDTWASRYLEEIEDRSAGSRAISGSALRLTVAGRIAIVRQIAQTLILLGLIGTVVGFIIALSAVDPAQASDTRHVAPMVAELIRGMSVALYTTLAGAIGNLWLGANYRLLSGAATTLIAELIALGERYAKQ